MAAADIASSDGATEIKTATTGIETETTVAGP